MTYTRSSRSLHALAWLLLVVLAAGCTGIPDGVEPVDDFELERYLGDWYEIARLDHSFERGLEKVSAEYSLQEDGSIRVVNRGYSAEENAWEEAEGRARFADDPQRGHLEVSFFGPFYASYVIFELDREDYRYAFVSGPDRSYLWLLARTPTVSSELLDRFIRRSENLGFDTDRLILVDQQ